MTDVLKQLQRASWRDIEFPVSGREFGFQQEQARHRFIFVDNQLIESLGRDNPTYRYRIPFREDIVVGPWTNLFVSVYPDFLAACQDRKRGILIDPLHGAIGCKCVSLREVLSVNRRDGIDVEAEFIRAPLETDFANDLGTQIRTLEGARNTAGLFDQALQKVDWKQYTPPEPTVSPLDAISAVGNQIEVAGGQASAALADSAFRVEKSIDTIDRLKNPNLAPTRQRARRLQDALLTLEDTTDPTGTHPLRRVTNTVNRTVAALAKLLGMTVTDLVRLNPLLARTPLVNAGTEIRVFADTLASRQSNAASQ